MIINNARAQKKKKKFTVILRLKYKLRSNVKESNLFQSNYYVMSILTIIIYGRARNTKKKKLNFGERELPMVLCVCVCARNRFSFNRFLLSLSTLSRFVRRVYKHTKQTTNAQTHARIIVNFIRLKTH